MGIGCYYSVLCIVYVKCIQRCISSVSNTSFDAPRLHYILSYAMVLDQVGSFYQYKYCHKVVPLPSV